MNRMTEDIVGFFIATTIIAGFVFALDWAYEKEVELDIHGMSSERILARDSNQGSKE